MKKAIEGWARTLALLGGLAAGAAMVSGVPAPVEAQEGAASVEQSPDGVVNINTASTEELSRLPGIGASKAEAIVSLRERRGPFRRVEQVLFVRGIGRATLRRLRPMLTIEGPTTLGAQR